MTEDTLAHLICQAPKLTRAKHAILMLDHLIAKAREEAPELIDRLALPQVKALALGIADHSAYLWQILQIDPQRLLRLLDQAPQSALDQCLAHSHALCQATGDEAQVMRNLRQAKQEVALLIALADLGGLWSLQMVTDALARFADHAVQTALSFLLRQAQEAGKMTFASMQDPQAECGLVVIAMGKHGARELNYSSDIDLIVFYDPDTKALTKASEASQVFVAMTKRLAHILESRTEDGYVLRVDLRLRPDPGSTSVAISLPAAAGYYEVLGQNWERAALIKARAIAGQFNLGIDFLKNLTPFIWRKYFDFAAIADIHAMKRQIHAVRGHAEVAVAGHDLKLGRGGIREIEFFVQTQQLIFGGRRPHLRGSRTLDMLNALEQDGWVTKQAVKDLTKSYIFLRVLEHRLQMMADEQTQRLPSEPEALKRFANFCGYATLKKFETDVLRHLKSVEMHYARLFEHEPSLDTSKGSLVFTGVTDDPDTIATLSNMGFAKPQQATEIIRGWHFGRRGAVQSARAREVVTELVPALLQSFSGSADPDAALNAFDQALTRMPAAIELMAILKSNQIVRDLFADILGSAPRLANMIVQRPHVLDAAIDPALIQGQGDEKSYSKRLESLSSSRLMMEDYLDVLRDFAQEEMFLIGLRTLTRVIDPSDAGRCYSDLASVIVRETLDRVIAVFAQEHGQIPRGRFAIIALGKLGSREMTCASDLDLVLIYDHDSEHTDSDGARSLHSTQYYTRLATRLVTALTVATRRGRLYEIDMRLRPSGSKGPVATHLQSFADYHMKEAETWEHMALTRARCIAGDSSLIAELNALTLKILTLPREEHKLRKDIADMRQLILQEKGGLDPWDLKIVPGGLLDIEFIAQYLCLRWSARHVELVQSDTHQVLQHAARLGLLSADASEHLLSAHRLYTDFSQISRICIEGPFQPEAVEEGIRKRLAIATGLPQFKQLEMALTEACDRVRKIYDKLFSAV